MAGHPPDVLAGLWQRAGLPQEEQALLSWRALDFEAAAADAGLVVTALRSFDQWDATPQGQAIAAQPLMTIDRIGDAPPFALPKLHADERPLQGVKVLDLTRILAGPVGGKALAAYGADVMLVNSPHLPNIEAIADTSRGKRSAHVDLRERGGREAMNALLDQAHVFIQGYRPGALQSLGFGPADIAAKRPGVVYISLSAYGAQGRGPLGAASIPWCRWRWDSTRRRRGSGFGKLRAVRHSARLSRTPARWDRPSMPPGSDPPRWT